MSAPTGSGLAFGGGLAFPYEFKYGDGTAGRAEGMSLRDYFAAKAMQAIVSHDPTFSQTYVNQCAEDSYRYADAMLAERAK